MVSRRIKLRAPYLQTQGLIGASFSMDYLNEAWEKLKEWSRRLIETLLGPEEEPEYEPIPVPVDEQNNRGRS